MKDQYTATALIGGQTVTGYYVFCRGSHYILEPYGNNGYDERWETGEWILVDGETVTNIRIKELEAALTQIKDTVLVNYKKDNTMYNLAYNILKKCQKT